MLAAGLCAIMPQNQVARVGVSASSSVGLDWIGCIFLFFLFVIGCVSILKFILTVERDNATFCLLVLLFCSLVFFFWLSCVSDLLSLFSPIGCFTTYWLFYFQIILVLAFFPCLPLAFICVCVWCFVSCCVGVCVVCGV